MNKIVDVILFPLKVIFLGIIYVYKWCISPLIPKVCRFYPSCSTYAVMAIREFGVIKGSYLAFLRLGRCTPHGKCGYNPLPQNIKGDSKWII